LAQGLISIGQGHGIETKALITNMEQPLGRFCGNALEIHECLSILKREKFRDHDYQNFQDTEELSIELASQMIAISKKTNQEEARKMALDSLNSGRAYEKFAQVCSLQGGDLQQLPEPTESKEIKAQKDGFLEELNSEKIGIAGISLQAGRRVLTDKINPVAGIEIHKKLGDSVKQGDTLFTIHTDKNQNGIDEAESLLKTCHQITESKPKEIPLILERL
ncbi:MAG: thymidine phosphorylase, partial [Pseudomonadota bacterium]